MGARGKKENRNATAATSSTVSGLKGGFRLHN
jgi:hypothetical protein